MVRKKSEYHWLMPLIATIYYWVLSLYKLTQAPLWIDECMEFYCSITDKGSLRGITQYATMYERMAYIQQQPPLYNWLMCVWLKVNEGEWWYRFSSVIFGFVGMIAVYLLLKKYCSELSACIGVIVISSIYCIQYYLKEASEYSLVFAVLAWMIYVFMQLIDNPNTKKIIAYVILCVLAMYTQYGAIFTVAPMTVLVCVYFGKNKFWTHFKTFMISGALAILAAGVPLVYFFLIPQSTNSNSTLALTDKSVSFLHNNILVDYFYNTTEALKWMMLDFSGDLERFGFASVVIMVLGIVCGIAVYLKTKRVYVKYLLWSCFISSVLFYVLTRLKVYGYGWFQARYTFPLVTIYFLTIAVIIWETWNICALKLEHNKFMRITLRTCLIAGLLFYAFYGVHRVNGHWMKSDERQCVEKWYEMGPEDHQLYVGYGRRYPFVYYFTHNKKYDETLWDYVFVNSEVELGVDDEQVYYFENVVYPDGVPEESYILTGHYDNMVQGLHYKGYGVELVVDSTAYLYKITKPAE